jgi:hypothetical protein
MEFPIDVSIDAGMSLEGMCWRSFTDVRFTLTECAVSNYHWCQITLPHTSLLREWRLLAPYYRHDECTGPRPGLALSLRSLAALPSKLLDDSSSRTHYIVSCGRCTDIRGWCAKNGNDEIT